MYDPELNNGVDWHDLTAKEKLQHLIDENAWLVGEKLAEQDSKSTHKQNVALARRFVKHNYPELWQHVHGNFHTWPEPGALERLVANTTGLGVTIRR